MNEEGAVSDLNCLNCRKEVSAAGNVGALKEIYQKIQFSVAAISLWLVK